MKMKKLSKLIAVFMMLVLVAFQFTLIPTAVSEEKGSITLNLTDKETKTPLAEIPFRLYFIAEANIESSGISYEFLDAYADAKADPENLQDSYLAVHLAHFAISEKQPYTEKSTDKNGVLVFDNLEKGLYLAVSVNEAEDAYKISPFVISVPVYDSYLKKWEYHIDATPKTPDFEWEEEDSETYISVIKKWETETSHPESITVVLLKDFKEYLKVELNADNGWHYRFDKLSKSHIWSVVEENVPDGYKVYYETSSNTVTIINKSEKPPESTTKPPEGETEEDKLVQTGQLNWPVPVCAIAGLLIFSIGWAVLNFGKKESE